MSSTIPAINSCILHKINPAFDRLDQMLVGILKDQVIDDQSLITILKERMPSSKDVTPAEHIHSLRSLLGFALINEMGIKGDHYKNLINDFTQAVLSIKFWEEFQLANVYYTICNNLLRNQQSKLNVTQFESGAVPLDSGGHWTWGNCPHQINHAEFGVICAVLAKVTSDQTLLKTVDKLSQWQTNTISHNSTPLRGLFTQELQASSMDSLIWDYLLYLTAGTFLNKPSYIGVAEKLKVKLQELPKSLWSVPPITAAIEQWVLLHNSIPTAHQYHLTELIHDPVIGVIGRRNQEKTVVSTICGGKTGMGTFYVNDQLSIVTYGPQLLPLGDCQAFGIETISRSNMKFEGFTINKSEAFYSIKGYCKIPGKESVDASYSTYGNSQHSEFWVDVQQQFDNDSLDIEVTFLGFDSYDELAFTFFVRASECTIDDSTVLAPKSLDRYKGDLGSIKLTSQDKAITILPQYQGGSMEIIPLAGDDNFWGGEFLIGFSVKKEQPKMGWTIF